MSGVAFVDTETLGLVPHVHPIWEIAIIVDGDEYCWQVDVRHALAEADPVALEINGFHERYSQDDARSGRWAAESVADLLKGRHIVGAVPSFDEERLRLAHDYWLGRPDRYPWHYHLIDVEALAVGYIAGRSEYGVDLPTLPWDSEDLSLALGVHAPEGRERHTALADARWAKAIYDHIIGGIDV